MSNTPCTLPIQSEEPDCLQLVNLFGSSNINCTVNDKCSGFECCVYMDFRATQRNVYAFINVDPCNFKISIGLGQWFLDISFFTYSWGTMRNETLGNAITVL